MSDQLLLSPYMEGISCAETGKHPASCLVPMYDHRAAYPLLAPGEPWPLPVAYQCLSCNTVIPNCPRDISS